MSKESRSGGAGADRRTPRLLIYPVGDTEARILLEGQTEGAVATVADAPGQELGRDGTAGRDGLAIEPDEISVKKKRYNNDAPEDIGRFFIVSFLIIINYEQKLFLGAVGGGAADGL